MMKAASIFGFTKYINNRTIRTKILITCIINTLILLVVILTLFESALYNLEIKLTEDSMNGDIHHLIDVINNGQNDAQWLIKNNELFRGNVSIGGFERINRDSTLYDKMFEKTGTTFFIALRCPEIPPNNDVCIPGRYLYIAGDSYFASSLNTLMNEENTERFEIDQYYSRQIRHKDDFGYAVFSPIRDNQNQLLGMIVASRNLNEIKTQMTSIAWKIFLLLGVIIILSGITISFIMTKWTDIIPLIRTTLNRAQKGETPTKSLMNLIPANKEFQDVRSEINGIASSIKEKQRMDSELAFAQSIQKNMLPNVFPPFPNHNQFDIFALMNPAKEVSGDFYDLFMPDNDHIAIVIADVSGKGVPAALFMVSTKTLIKNYLTSGLTPTETFEKVNNTLCELNKTGHFVTAWMGLLNIHTGKLQYVNAGHNPPLYADKSKTFSWLKQRSGFVLAGLSNTHYKPFELTMHPGEKLLLYTDGVTEAKSIQNKLYGNDKLLDFMNTHVQNNIKDTLQLLISDVELFSKNTEQFDDITMLMLEYNGEQMVSKTFNAKLDKLPEIVNFAKEKYIQSQWPENFFMKLRLVIEEIFTNIVHYAYPNGEGRVCFNLTINDKQIEMTFVDNGTPFNPLETSTPDIHSPKEERNVGGLGIFMAKNLMDEMKYELKDGENRLTLIKKRQIE